jgi:hypothetical protein
MRAGKRGPKELDAQGLNGEDNVVTRMKSASRAITFSFGVDAGDERYRFCAS